MQNRFTRRTFIAASTIAGFSLATTRLRASSIDKPALLGGTPVRTEPFPSWPVYDETEVQALQETLRTGQWFRGSGKNANTFETAFAEMIGAKYCVATSSGTAALIASLNALGVGAGDEVILPPYTFIACANAILLLGALPVFVDIDPGTFQLDATKIEAAVTDRTVAIMPVHLAGASYDVDAVRAIATKHKLAMVEDACQAVMGEWKGKRVGQFGDTGCFSFQASKNLAAGEGGAILTSSEELAEKCFAAHNNSRPRNPGGAGKDVRVHGVNLRMSEFHAGLLMAQMKRLPEQAKTRDENAAYLAKQLSEIPGVVPMKLADGCTRSAWHLFPFRYQSEGFAGLSRSQFLKALAAEGVRGSTGYTPLNQEPSITTATQGRGFSRSFPPEVLAGWSQRTACPENERLCSEAIWFSQTMLLAERSSMDQTAEAIRKIGTHAGELAKI